MFNLDYRERNMGCHSNHEKCCCPCHQKQEEETCHGEDQHEDHTEWFLEIADAAWTEVLKDKIKEHILTTQNDRMTELAKIVSEGNSSRWKLKMEQENSIEDFQENICRFFSQHKK